MKRGPGNPGVQMSCDKPLRPPTGPLTQSDSKHSQLYRLKEGGSFSLHIFKAKNYKDDVAALIY